MFLHCSIDAKHKLMFVRVFSPGENLQASDLMGGFIEAVRAASMAEPSNRKQAKGPRKS